MKAVFLRIDEELWARFRAHAALKRKAASAMLREMISTELGADRAKGGETDSA